MDISQGLPFHDIKEFSLSRQSWISLLLGQKYPVQLRHLSFIRDRSQPVPLEKKQILSGNASLPSCGVPACSRSFPILRTTGTPRLPGHFSTTVVLAMQRQTFTILSGGGTTVQTSSGVLLFASRQLTLHALDWLHKEQQMRTRISLRIQKGQDTVKCQILRRSQRNSKSPDIQQIYENTSFPSA